MSSPRRESTSGPPARWFPWVARGFSKRSAGRAGVVVYEDANRPCGFAAELSALIAELAFADLCVPIRRVTRGAVPIPYSVPLELETIASPGRLPTAIREPSVHMNQ